MTRRDCKCNRPFSPSRDDSRSQLLISIFSNWVQDWRGATVVIGQSARMTSLSLKSPLKPSTDVISGQFCSTTFSNCAHEPREFVLVTPHRWAATSRRHGSPFSASREVKPSQSLKHTLSSWWQALRPLILASSQLSTVIFFNFCSLANTSREVKFSKYIIETSSERNNSDAIGFNESTSNSVKENVCGTPRKSRRSDNSFKARALFLTVTSSPYKSTTILNGVMGACSSHHATHCSCSACVVLLTVRVRHCSLSSPATVQPSAPFSCISAPLRVSGLAARNARGTVSLKYLLNKDMADVLRHQTRKGKGERKGTSCLNVQQSIKLKQVVAGCPVHRINEST
ncbi:hypothetical protein AGDE_16379 [Angomonas deanei]|uniref:Uncharacterized protein n=1 Tax=Angomonas deanei TaxID=59799 RepID=A0A7G2CVC9_9TRYP|nr:hypothetical protein AGDE_16379 [Angomonas deanei]CAD2222884.1 hypothetical protein, conserved [Angomonas deanei]|eukprot:EPY17183.1 hypothetical protein AGDE_16379 [Angomonas deanei]